MAEIDNLLRPMVHLDASDLHLRVGIKPRYRLQGRLQVGANGFTSVLGPVFCKCLLEMLGGQKTAGGAV